MDRIAANVNLASIKQIIEILLMLKIALEVTFIKKSKDSYRSIHAA